MTSLFFLTREKAVEALSKRTPNLRVALRALHCRSKRSKTLASLQRRAGRHYPPEHNPKPQNNEKTKKGQTEADGSEGGDFSGFLLASFLGLCR